MNGDTVTLPVPGKTTVLHFFSLSCAQCIEGIQAVGKAQQAVAADYIAVAIDPGDEPEDITGMLCAAGSPQLTVARDTDATLLRTWRVTAPATTIVVDSTGKIAFRGVVPTAEELTEAIRGVTT
ncbi:TlpA family protein disulfide reductase [Lentzea flaviverrucosa]|uniref:TlpA family protein disulfide reductase n=1 Tax=Lentzea flaviverrucosa TaxID=200379 RepID=UPI001476DD66|nr:redoxin domain-containing protein [Lentzea flaviverrucosa]